jgi:hypoxanthine phosphoribosyltransferase
MYDLKTVRPGKTMIAADEISSIVARLGREISRDYEGRNPILLNLLKGGVVFLADLIRQLEIPHMIEFMHVTSYENGTSSSGQVKIVDDLTCSVENRDVLIVEDVIDTGTTLAYISNMLQLRKPRSVEICTLLRKNVETDSRVSIRYVGKEIPNVFVVGYGLDYDERFRNLPYVARLEIGGDSNPDF